ncbi:hypothetical protein UY3_05732 [Chelonia mydas]|uniref:Uncharacterized protein n=1 Tax=Chelonia mydas TaxID=8469 RepID=M7BH14_CHEMY|nr:hypothetical protein UY3_05732 [Chelonia mydas]
MTLMGKQREAEELSYNPPQQYVPGVQGSRQTGVGVPGGGGGGGAAGNRSKLRNFSDVNSIAEVDILRSTYCGFCSEAYRIFRSFVANTQLLDQTVNQFKGYQMHKDLKDMLY